MRAIFMEDLPDVFMGMHALPHLPGSWMPGSKLLSLAVFSLIAFVQPELPVWVCGSAVGRPTGPGAESGPAEGLAGRGDTGDCSVEAVRHFGLEHDCDKTAMTGIYLSTVM